MLHRQVPGTGPGGPQELLPLGSPPQTRPHPRATPEGDTSIQTQPGSPRAAHFKAEETEAQLGGGVSGRHGWKARGPDTPPRLRDAPPRLGD